MALTKARRVVLTFARDWQSLDDGEIELGLQTGLWGAALRSVRDALIRDGYIDRDTGLPTKEGLFVLAVQEEE